jgi:TPP-dependent trihydroxycyclohexane-1,2-dione (THcHDO) dehydratase
MPILLENFPRTTIGRMGKCGVLKVVTQAALLHVNQIPLVLVKELLGDEYFFF